MLLGVERRRKDAGAGDEDGEEQEEEYGAVPMASVRSDDDTRSEHFPFPFPTRSSPWTPALLDLEHFICQFWVHCTVP